MERRTAQDYFREALAILGEQGSEALTIAALGERLGVTKGSFYHHFDSMPSFITALLEYWEREHSDELIATVRAIPEPAQRVASFAQLAANLPHATEAALRAWGRSNSEVAAVIGRVDRRRERYLADALGARTRNRENARLRARLILNVLIGAQQREQSVDRKRLRQMFDLILQN